MDYIREPSVAGSFYPDNPSLLKRTIEKYLDNAQVPMVDGEPIGLISPHAGYMYSGQVAAYGYKALIGKTYDTVIIIAPSHRSYFEGIAVIEKGSYRTPLGTVSIDQDLTSKILKEDSVTFAPNFQAHLGEHSVEVQIPFLQIVLKDFAIVPLLMGAQNRKTWRGVASVLFNVAQKEKKKFLFLASTDLSHYFPYEKAKKLDGVVLRNVEEFNIEKMEKDYENESYEACGGGPMISVMMISRLMGAKKGIVLKYANSGDVSGDKSAVVGYMSALFVI
ncbi:MAG: AmmeMemoRadiSam system protein B [Deltaproteobacteria bacterium]|nr:AmmeMemoRadiSam system protein B [Deltaproteobacteria bacterium]